MTNTPIKKKKISEYNMDDLKEFFYNLSRKISSKIILLEIGNDFFNIAVAKLVKNQLQINNVFRQVLPKEAIEKSIPADPDAFSAVLVDVIKDLKLGGQRIALVLSADACYTRLIDIPGRITSDKAKSFLEDPDSGIQIPISLNNSDFDIHLTDLPEKKKGDEFYKRYFLTSLPKKSVNTILETINKANLELCSIQMSHMCIGNLLSSEINKLDSNNLIISVDLLDEFTQLIIFDNSGPLFIKRLASIRNYPTIDEMKEIQNRGRDEKIKSSKKLSSDYHPLSKLDLKILIREINNTFKNFIQENDLIKIGKIFLSGRNSQHENLVEILGNNLSMDVFLISPIGIPDLKEFNYDPDKLNQFSMSRIIGLGLSLIREKYENNENLLSSNSFIIKKYIHSELESSQNKLENSNKSSELLIETDNKKKEEIKKTVIKKEEDKKKNELPPLPNLDIKKKEEIKKTVIKKEEEDKKKNELPPLPNLDIKNKKRSKEKVNYGKDEKSIMKNKKESSDKNEDKFTMDTTFLDID